LNIVDPDSCTIATSSTEIRTSISRFPLPQSGAAAKLDYCEAISVAMRISQKKKADAQAVYPLTAKLNSCFGWR
jgi:hypothetical protein